MEIKNDMEQYFNSLPSFIKESIVQSGVLFNNQEELESLVENIKKKN